MKIEKIKKEIKEKENEIIKLKEQLATIHEYESVIIINTNTTLKEFEKIKILINNIINKENILKFEELGTKKFVHTIKKQNEGYYLSINFESTEKILYDLERFYRTNNNILKYITIKKED